MHHDTERPDRQTTRHYLPPDLVARERGKEQRREREKRDRRDREELGPGTREPRERELQEGITRRREREAEQDEQR